MRIRAGLMIPGRGAPVADACVDIDGDRITHVGPASDAAPTTGAEVSVPVLMPGMWDAHCHFFGITSGDLTNLFLDDRALRATRIVRDAERALMAGITSVREVGGLGVHLQRAIAEGSAVGPEIYAAGGMLSTTGGHGDIHTLPLEVMTASERLGDLVLCDGADGCRRAVREQLRMGARVIKVCASGGVLSRFDDPLHAQFSHEELTAIVEEAARADRVVAAHCHGKAGIMASLRAGVRTIEHGTWLDAESARAMADVGAILVSTRLVGEALLDPASTVPLPDFARETLTRTYRRGAEAIGHALAAGVTFAAGTDLLTSGDLWGRNGREAALLVECGLTPLGAVEAITANGPATVGPQAPDVGIVREGWVADLIALDGDPLDDIAILGESERITHVWKSGRLVKGSGS